MAKRPPDRRVERRLRRIPRPHPRLESLECRELRATFFVFDLSDNSQFSLRQAILNSNATPGPNIIDFNNTLSGTISPQSPLPTITQPVTIDGTTGQGYAGKPVIAIDGSGAGTSANGLTIQAAGTAINALAIGGFAGSGVEIDGPGGDTIQGCFLGTDLTGTEALGNGVAGVNVSDSPNNTIGGTTFPGAGGGTGGPPVFYDASNLISGNLGDGILIQGFGSAGNEVINDTVGLDFGASSPLGNGTGGTTGTPGILLTNRARLNTISGCVVASNLQGGVGFVGSFINTILDSTIGTNAGDAAGLGNGEFGVLINGTSIDIVSDVISGNAGPGISIGSGSNSINVMSSKVGTNSAGTAPLPNTGDGIILEGSQGVAIGRVNTTNVISGNGGFGVHLLGGAAMNGIIADRIGTDIVGTSAIPNAKGGVLIADSPNNFVTSFGDQANVISGNNGPGLWLLGSATTQTTVDGPNEFGTNLGGTAAIPNQGEGILIDGAMSSNVGGDTLIMGNTGDGVLMRGGASFNQLLGMRIGLAFASIIPIPNGGDGVAIDGGRSNTINGVIASGNLGDGIHLLDDTTANDLQSCTIGLANDAITAVSNGGDGIAIESSSNTTIGGSLTLSTRVSGNNGAGIHLSSGTTGTVIHGTLIGTDYTGSLAVPNLGGGVVIEDSPENQVGGPISDYGDASLNVISGNIGSGVRISGEASSGNVVDGNLIGTNLDRTSGVPNLGAGVSIAGAPNTRIGGPSGAANVISGNTGTGISIQGADSAGTLVVGNYIGVDPTGRLPLGNSLTGVFIFNSSFVTIGGTTAAERNVISGNLTGVVVGGGQATGDLVQGNAVGTDVTETMVIGNLNGGIVLEAQAESSGGGTPNHITIGGVTAGSGNVVSGNTGTGIDVTGQGTDSNLIAGNVVGLDVMGRPMGNTGDGILVEQDAANNTIGGQGFGRNLVSSNGGMGIELNGGSGNLVVNSFVGTDPSGTLARPNQGAGVLVESPGNTVGGPIGSLGNLVSGNGLSGIDVTDGGADTLVIGNLVGVDATGSVGLPNHDQGVAIVGTPGVTIGGTTLPLRNVVSGNTYGVLIEGSGAVGDLVQGNFVGTDQSGAFAVPNSMTGVIIQSDAAAQGIGSGPPTMATIGGITDGAGNLVSGNAQGGVTIQFDGRGSNLIAGNVIGLSFAGMPLGNGDAGVTLFAAGQNTIGAPGPGHNVISSNLGGLQLIGAPQTLVVNNLIGTDGGGIAARPNQTSGIDIVGSSDATIGGTSGLRNYVSGNLGEGIILGDLCTRDVLAGNVIGLNLDGNPLGNGGDGILLTDGTTGNFIGVAGNSPNVISSNGHSGVYIQDGPINTFKNNFIGTDPTGMVARPNASHGLRVESLGNTIGGPADGDRNLISGNDGAGIELPSFLTRIYGNLIGTNVLGNSPIPNGADGIEIGSAASDDIIGGPGGLGNLISGNRGNGVLVDPNGNLGILLVGNRIGTDAAGEHAVPNGSNGIAIVGALGVVVGGMTADRGNLISGNVGDGILTTGMGAMSNLIASNTIGTDLLRIRPLGNGAAGIDVQGAPGTTIGGSVATGNLVAASGGVGISVEPSGSGGPLGGMVVAGNLVGTNGSALAGLGNRAGGVLLSGTSAASINGNVVSGNVGDGLTLDASTGATIVNNKFGTDASLRATLPNTGDGLVLANGSTGNQVGGINTYDGNDLSGNGGDGLSFQNGSSGNLVEGNAIGIGADAARMPNGGDGIGSRSSSNTIGGGSAAAGNLIGANLGDGIHLVGVGVNSVVGNVIGTDPSGVDNLGNAGNGIHLEGAPGSTIAGNLIEANGHSGIVVAAGSDATTIVGNQVGQDDGPLGNANNGVLIDASAGVTVGGTSAAARNVVEANAGEGVLIQGGSTGTQVVGNTIGLDRSGRAGHGNADGVVVLRSPGTSIRSNVIGSNGIGVDIVGAAATGTDIAANDIGLGADGLAFAGNATDGIFIDGAPGVVVEQDVISGNGEVGVQASGAGASGTVIRGNRIGTDASGTVGRGNGLVGVFINGAPGSLVGGTDAASRNLIGGNGSVGLQVDGTGAAGTLVEANWIGLDATGLRPIGNGLDGILLEAPGVTIGGISPGARNVVSGNGSVGIDIATSAATGNAILGNWVGLDATGLGAVGNGVIGLIINGAKGNVVGGTQAGSGNVITGSGSVDVEIAGASASGNVIAGDLIGTDATGLAGLAAAPNGIFINASPGNLIGGTSPGAGNLIGGHAAVGIEVFNRTASGNSIFGNRIGPGPSGAASLRNGLGILIINAPRNVVGGGSAGRPNTIVGNGSNGIKVTGVLAVGNVTTGNVIGPDQAASPAKLAPASIPRGPRHGRSRG